MRAHAKNQDRWHGQDLQPYCCWPCRAPRARPVRAGDHLACRHRDGRNNDTRCVDAPCAGCSRAAHPPAIRARAHPVRVWPRRPCDSPAGVHDLPDQCAALIGRKLRVAHSPKAAANHEIAPIKRDGMLGANPWLDLRRGVLPPRIMSPIVQPSNFVTVGAADCSFSRSG